MCNKRETLDANGDPDFDVKPLKESEIPPECLRFDYDHQWWDRIVLGVIGHACSIYYFAYLLPFGHISMWTFPVGMVYTYLSVGVGSTVGAHRYWTHKTFKANKAMQILLMLQQTSCMHFTIYYWCRNHRVHHKYTDTNADPHNASRGFWYSHIGWLWLPTHPDVIKARKVIDMSDLAHDPIIRFQSKYFWELVILVVFLFPIPIFGFFFPEMTLTQHIVGTFARYITGSHVVFFVNSYAHLWGNRPYDKYISSTETGLLANLLTIGEGWHNYHHAFPWDYKAAELGGSVFNFSAAYINFFAKIGWVWDMKTVSHKLLKDRINRTGDASHPLHLHHGKSVDEIEQIEGEKDVEDVHAGTHSWGWGDNTISKEDREITQILCRKSA